MTDDRSLERAARSWLEAGPTRAPERAVEAALLRIESTPQDRDLRIPWRFQQMNASWKLAAGAAAAVAIAILGSTLLTARPAPDIGGPTQSSTATPSATAPPTPSSSPSPGVFTTGPLAAGTYTTDPGFPVGITFTVPNGWSGLASGSTVKVLDSGRASFVSFWDVQTAVRNPCGLAGGDDSPVGPTVDDLAEALAGAPGFETTDPMAEDVDGLEARYVELRGPEAGCMEPQLWSTRDGSCRCMESRPELNRLWILEVGGTRLVINALLVATSGDEEGATPAEIAEVEAIIDSIEISR